MRLASLSLALVVSLLLASSAAAQTCTLSAGEYVDTDPRDEAVSPAYVLEASGDPCYVTVRMLTLPGEAFDAYTPAFYEMFLQPLAGPPPYDKPYGCPYAPGDAADLRDQYGEWYPATITSSDRYCGYQVDYWVGTAIKSFGATDYDLRPATLVPPSQAELAEAEANKFCPPGGALADYAGGDLDSLVRHGIVTEISQSVQAEASVVFDKLRGGETAVASAGSIYHSRNPDASVGTVIYPYRIEVTVCVPGEPERSLSRFALDYSCYTDRFGDFICRRDAGRPLN